MHGRMKLSAWLLALTFGLLGLFGTARTASAQVSDAEKVARAFVDAINAGDAEAMRALVAPGTRFKFNGDTSFDSAFESEASLDEFIGAVNGVTISINSLTNVDANTVEMEVTLTGDPVPPLIHPYVVVLRITSKDGQITAFAERLSEQTGADLEAEQDQPGMPTTGTSNMDLVTLGLALGLLFLTLGVATRRARSA